ncbi:MAG: ABC transporter permease subunit [Armatimonadetes bacterium]|nr:ABC transporter permease subunit [Armatimonadota bacterium]
MSEPIADLSYRDYSGAHLEARGRWLVIARMGWKTAFKKRAYWVFTSLAAWYYLVMIAFLYVLEQLGIAQKMPGISEQVFNRLVWKDQFLTGFTYSQLIWLTLGLMVGVGAVANDNGTNALLVYLSKPCRKIDYLIGKWTGVFVPLAVGMAVPTAFFFLYGLLNFREYRFIEQDPALGFRLIGMVLGAAAFQASLILGISSLFNKGRMAGAAYAAAFFLLTFFSFLMFIAWAVSQGGRRHKPNEFLGATAERLYYLSIDGLQIGWAKVVLGTDGSQPFGAGGNMPQMAAPPAALVVVPMVLIAVGGIALAWKRIRAVEVVK